MKKILTVLSLCMLFSIVPSAKALAVTQIAPINESQIEATSEISIPSDKLSQKYLEEYEAVKPWENWICSGTMICILLIGAMIIVNLFCGSTELFSHQKPISIMISIISLVTIVGLFKLDDKINSREMLYKASLIDEISEAYIKDNGKLPIQGEYQGAGESNLLYALDIKEMAKYRVSIANMDFNRFFIENETGEVYYKPGDEKEFIKPY